MADAQHTSVIAAVCHHACDARNVNSIHCVGGARPAATYGDLWRLSYIGKQALTQSGVCRGDRVALVMEMSLETVALVLAVMRSGAVIVPIQPIAHISSRLETGLRILGTLRVSGAKLLISPDSGAAAFGEILGDSISSIVSAEKLLAGGAQNPPMSAEQHSDDTPALIQFSSGSTGTPKGVCLTSANIRENLAAIVDRVGMRSTDRVISWAPFHHDLGLIGALLCSLWSGCSAEFYSPGEFVRNPLGWLKKAGVLRSTITVAPQFAYSLCVSKAQTNKAALAGTDLSAMRFMLNGGEFIHAHSMQAFQDAFAPYGLRSNVVQPAYGLAENCVAVTMRVPGTAVQIRELPRHLGELVDNPLLASTVALVGNGRPLDGTEISIADAQGNQRAAGEIGDIRIRGKSAARSYVLEHDSDSPTHVDGWLRTGDIGALIDGELYVAGRQKEVFKRGGRTFAPPDIEHSLCHALGAEVGSIAAFAFYDHPSGIEKLNVILEIKRADRIEPPWKLGNLVRKHVLKEFQCSVDDIFITSRGSLPRTSSGKIRRAHLSNLAQLQQLGTIMQLSSVQSAADLFTDAPLSADPSSG